MKFHALYIIGVYIKTNHIMDKKKLTNWFLEDL